MSHNPARRISRRGLSRRRKEVRREQQRLAADADRRLRAQAAELRASADDWDILAEELDPELADIVLGLDALEDDSDAAPAD